MTGEVINLRGVRKARARSEKDAQAAANRLKFGRTKSERANEKTQAERDSRLLDGARRERDDD